MRQASVNRRRSCRSPNGFSPPLPDISVLVTTGTVTLAKLMEEVAAARSPPVCPARSSGPLRAFSRSLAARSGGVGRIRVLAQPDCSRPCVRRAAGAGQCAHYRKLVWQMASARRASSLTCASERGRDAAGRRQRRRLRGLGSSSVLRLGNLKHDAPPLPHDATELARLRGEIGARPVWIASNTHEGEERAAAEAHLRLAQAHPNLLTIVVPRHPARGASVAAECRGLGLQVAQRSTGDRIAPCDEYLSRRHAGRDGSLLHAPASPLSAAHSIRRVATISFEAARLDSALIAATLRLHLGRSLRGLREGQRDDAHRRRAGCLPMPSGVFSPDEALRRRMAASASAAASADSGAAASRALEALFPVAAGRGECCPCGNRASGIRCAAAPRRFCPRPNARRRAAAGLGLLAPHPAAAARPRARCRAASSASAT